jgi:hypothetical protein
MKGVYNGQAAVVEIKRKFCGTCIYENLSWILLLHLRLV